jgi:hypothetical protein
MSEIQLTATGKRVYNKAKKDELRCVFLLPDAVTATGVWYAGWGMARAFVVSLNLATRGFFWWYVPSDTGGFYDEIWDLENNAGVQITEGPRLELDWGNLVLKPADMIATSVAFSYLMKHMGLPQERPFNHYIGGLIFLSKVDFHLRGEINAMGAFGSALREALLVHGDWDGSSDYQAAAATAMSRILTDTGDFERHLALSAAVADIRAGGVPPTVTLTEAIGMKLYCDLYLGARVNEWAASQRAHTE